MIASLCPHDVISSDHFSLGLQYFCFSSQTTHMVANLPLSKHSKQQQGEEAMSSQDLDLHGITLSYPAVPGGHRIRK